MLLRQSIRAVAPRSHTNQWVRTVVRGWRRPAWPWRNTGPVIQWLQAPACSWATRWVCRLMPRSRRGMGSAGRDGGDEWWARVFRRGWLQHCGTSSHTVINSHLRRRGVSFKTWLCTHTHVHTHVHASTHMHTPTSNVRLAEVTSILFAQFHIWKDVV